MALQYDIKPDEAQLADAISLFEFVGGNTSDAVRVAINKTAPKIRTRASSAIRSQVRLTAAYVRDRLTIRKAMRTNLTGAIQTPSRGLLLSRFSTDPLIAGDKVDWIKPPLVPAGGIKVKVKPDGEAKAVGGKPFYMVLKNSRAIGIVRRIGAGRRGIEVLHGPSLSQVFNTVRDDVLPEATAEYQAQLLDAMRYLLAKKYPPEAAEA